MQTTATWKTFIGPFVGIALLVGPIFGALLGWYYGGGTGSFIGTATGTSMIMALKLAVVGGMIARKG